MTTHARPLTDELYTELEEELERLVTHRNPWAASWLQILATLEEDQRPAVLAALINGLPELYAQMRELGEVALRLIAIDAIATGSIEALTDVEVPPKPPSVPDHLGALFAPLSEPNIAGPKYASATTPELEAELKADAGVSAPVSEFLDNYGLTDDELAILEARSEEE